MTRRVLRAVASRCPLRPDFTDPDDWEHTYRPDPIEPPSIEVDVTEPECWFPFGFRAARSLMAADDNPFPTFHLWRFR